MKHNEYGDSVAAVIVSPEGELVAQELEHGFDQRAMDAVREYLAEKGIEWIREEENIYPLVYRHTLTYAMEHGEADAYLDSRRLHIACRQAVEDAIRSNFDGLRLKDDVVDSVLEEYGIERLSFVLACTVQNKMWDGRFSGETRKWASGISVEENINRERDTNQDYVIESHPAVMDGFINLFRKQTAELETVKGVENVGIEQDKNEEPEQLAYKYNDQYFLIQVSDEGYDYTFYDAEYRNTDGGIYDNVEVCISEVAKELLEDAGVSIEDAKKMNYDEVIENLNFQLRIALKPF